MDINILLTIIFGLGVPFVTFLITYQKTIGARKEREKTAYREIVSLIAKLIAHEQIKPNLEVITGLIKSKAREHDVNIDLSSVPLIFEDAITKFVENEFISQEVKKSLIDKVLILQKETLGAKEIQEVLGIKEITKEGRGLIDILASTAAAILTASIGIYTIYKMEITAIPEESLKSIYPMVVIAVLVVIILTGYFYIKQKMEEKFRTKMEIMSETIEKETSFISDLRDMAENDVNELRHKVESFPRPSLNEKPSSEVREKLDEFSRRLETLEMLGVSLKPEDYIKRGDDYYYKEKYELALKAYEKALELKPDYVEAWFDKGAALSYLGQYDEALKAVEKALELKPDYAEAWSTKGAALSNLGRYDEALKAIEKAIELKPELANSWYNRACIYSIKGNREKALSELEKAIEIDESHKEKAKKDKDFEKLRGDVEFEKLID